MEIKDWIKAARLHAHLTQEEPGDKLGLTKGNLSAWENGRHEPGFRQIIKIGKITQYPLPTDEGIPEEPPPAVWPFCISRQQYARLAPAIQAAIDTFLSTAAKNYPINNDDYAHLTETVSEALRLMRKNQ